MKSHPDFLGPAARSYAESDDAYLSSLFEAPASLAAFGTPWFLLESLSQALSFASQWL